MGIFFEEMMLDFPGVIDADAVSELDLFQRLAINAVLRLGIPGRPRRFAPCFSAETAAPGAITGSEFAEGSSCDSSTRNYRRELAGCALAR
jgi:hypothetical protein